MCRVGPEYSDFLLNHREHCRAGIATARPLPSLQTSHDQARAGGSVSHSVGRPVGSKKGAASTLYIQSVTDRERQPA